MKAQKGLSFGDVAREKMLQDGGAPAPMVEYDAAPTMAYRV